MRIQSTATLDRLSSVVLDNDRHLNETILVLHVDDELGLLKIAKSFLEAHGPFDVEMATSVESALTKIRKRPFDAVVSDFQMPGQDGLTFLKKLRESGNKVPFIMLTGKGREEVAIEALNLGADRYINKSGRPETVYGELVYALLATVNASRELRRSHQKFQGLFMNNPEAAVYVDTNFEILEVNLRFTELFGFPLSEIAGKRVNDILVPADKIEEAELLDRNVRIGYLYYETIRKRRNGTLVPVSISAAPVIVDGDLVGHMALYRDLSKLKKTEQELKVTLEQLKMINEKLRVVGQQSQHDILNKLSVAAGHLFLARQQLVEKPEVMKHLDEAGSVFNEIKRIFDFARAYERLGAEEQGLVDVGKCIDNAVSLLSKNTLSRRGIKLENLCDGLLVIADSMLSHLFFNLIDNTLKHGGKKVTKITILHVIDSKSRQAIVYEDNGKGIKEIEKKQVFSEGYGKGTGYGLYLARKICEVYGWDIRETGKYGKGAKFTILWPKMRKSPSRTL